MTGDWQAHNHSGGVGVDGAHNHTASADVQGAHAHNVSDIMILGSSGLGSNTPVPAGAGTRATDVQGAHTHTISIGVAGGHQHSLTIDNAGGGAAHNNMQPTAFAAFLIKL